MASGDEESGSASDSSSGSGSGYVSHEDKEIRKILDLQKMIAYRDSKYHYSGLWKRACNIVLHFLVQKACMVTFLYFLYLT